jgi:pimeloyl-ACP methyl ester carboxylesterase
VTFDNRGVGETDLPGEPVYSTGQLADDAAALLKHLKIARVHVVGASMGGTIAMELALRQPRLVRSLTLACTWAEGDGRFLHTLESWMLLAHRVPIEDRYRHVLYAWLFSPEFFTRPRPRPSIGRAGGSWPGTARGSRSSAVSACPRSCSSARTTSSRRRPSRGTPGPSRARLVLVPGGHGFFLEHAEQFNRTLLRFLKSVRST